MNKVLPVCVILFCGFILAPGRELRAQESVDLPSKPEPTTAITQEDNSAYGASPNYTVSDAQVFEARFTIVTKGA